MRADFVQMLQTLAQHAPAAIALLEGPDFRYELVNEAYQSLAPDEPMLGRTVTEVWSAAASLALLLLENVRTTGTACHRTGMTFPMHRGPGSAPEERWFDFSYVPLDLDRVMVIAVEVMQQ